MATLKDIANLTGLSATTISNVIHGRSNRVSPETVERVNNAIRELGYVPNMSARSLASKSSSVVAFINHVIIQDDSTMMEDPFHSTAIGTIERSLKQNGYFLMLRTVKTTEELISLLQNWNVDGIFLTGVFNDAFFDALTSCQVPIVLIDSYVRNEGVYNVGLEDFHGTYLSTSHLIENGHRQIGFATPALKDGGVLQQRFLGYQAALKDHGISYDPSMIFEYEMDQIQSCFAAADAIAAHGNITGLVTAADQLAAGIMAGLRRRGIRVPEDLSVVGFDDLPLCELLNPPLTTIHQDMRQKAEFAAEVMIHLLHGELPAQANTVFPVRLVERESVRKIQG